jgi:hypothetical protein
MGGRIIKGWSNDHPLTFMQIRSNRLDSLLPDSLQPIVAVACEKKIKNH